jgi:hypothetical protein
MSAAIRDRRIESASISAAILSRLAAFSAAIRSASNSTAILDRRNAPSA